VIGQASAQIGWVLLVWSTLSVPLQARSWNALYTFGDSYTDSGAGYVDGNGPTAVVYLAQDLGIPFTYAGDTKFSGRGLNFAVSGAQSGKGEGVRMRPATAGCSKNDVLMGRGMETQVLDFARLVKRGRVRFDPEKTLFFLAGGINDSSLPPSTTVANIEGEIRGLYELGGRYFLVALLPTKIASFSDFAMRLNPALARIPQDLQTALPSIHVGISKWGEYFDRVMEAPSGYGIKNTTDRCAGRALFGEDPTPCSSPDTYFYFHDGHPSTAVQRIVASELRVELAQVFP
jgi:cholinesterase